jgi:putative heme iron utilization protein
MVAAAPEGANPQTAPRLTVTGIAAPAPDPALKARWLALHPYAALYADFADFSLWRVVPENALFVGGFARASRLRATDLTPDPASVAAVAAAAAGIVAHCNADHADTMGLLADPADPAGWAMVAVDPDGCDIARGERVARIDWRAPVSDANGVRAELIRLARAARSTG